MHTLRVEIPRTKSFHYPIFIGNEIIENSGNYLKEIIRGKKLLIVSNQKIFSLYGEKLSAALEKFDYKLKFLLIEEGEEYKNINSLEKIWTRAIELKLERTDAIIALGGGVIGDVTGFAAATYLRGIDFIQIPTTLLAQVDSSVGGKVAVNHNFGKNLIGNFYQPRAVITDVSTLNSLPFSEIKVGLAEVLKYAFIEKSCGLEGSGNSFLEFLDKNKELIISLDCSTIETLVKHCCELKAIVVNKDEKETGLRAILNFGHTIAHAIEKCYSYKGINHGEAVAIGMKGAFFLAQQRNYIDEKYYEYCINLLNKYEMNYKIDKKITPKSIYNAMQLDKKVQAGKIRFVLPVNQSEVKVFNDITENEIIKAVNFLY